MKSQGFGLVEFLVALAILAIVAGIGTTNLLGAMRRNQVDATTARLYAAFDLAKNRVRLTNKDVVVEVNTAGKQVLVKQGTTTLNTYSFPVSGFTLTCRTTANCPSGKVTLKAPHGTLPTDLKFVISAAGRTHTAYLLGPAGVSKVLRN